MRSIFWIGCIFTILVAIIGSGLAAESMENATVVGNTSETIATEANVTVPTETNATAVTDVNATNVTNVTPVVTAEPDLVNGTLVKFVKDAKAYALSSGKTSALNAFNDRNGQFAKPEMSIFAYDYTGKALALPYDATNVNINQISLADASGLRYVEQMRNVAKKGSGFAKFQAADLSDKGAVKEKTVYVLDVDGTWFIGAGVFVQEKPVVKPTEAPIVNETASATTNTTVSELPAEANTTQVKA